MNCDKSLLENKEKYKGICEQRPDEVPLFQQYWWMETVCTGKQWDVALAYDGDVLTGAMPYHVARRLGHTIVLQPQLTQFTGPVYFYPGDILSESHRLAFERRVASQLIAEMETIRPSAVIIHTSPGISNWLPFYWHGYKQTTRYTYRIPDIGDSDAVFAAFDKEKRQRKIVRTEKHTTVRFDMTATAFAALHHRYWASKGRKDCLGEDFISHVCAEALVRGHGVVGSLHDEDGALLAARFVVYDSKVAYSLLSAHEPGRQRSGHSETLMWAMMRHLCGRTRSFDFEGSMDEGIEYFYRSFGARQTPFFELAKYRNLPTELFFRLKTKKR